jgi:methionyl-tRNA formyltransferase
LIAGPHDIVGVVSQPDRRRGRGKKLSPSPVSEIALREGLPLLRPERIGEPEAAAELAALAPDLGVVVAFGQFLPKKIRELPSRGYLINAHASLLPKYRGASPIAQAILDGEPETGISVMRVDREMDAGPVALVEKTAIGERENTAELSARLAEIAADAISKAVDLIERDEITWTEQDSEHASVAPKIEKTDSVLDLAQSAESLVRRIHAMSPKPGGSLRLLTGSGGEQSEELLKVTRAGSLPYASGQQAAPGTLDRDQAGSEVAREGTLRIATGEGWLLPLFLQRAGGKALPVADFLRGYSLPVDARFAVETASSPSGASASAATSESETP